MLIVPFLIKIWLSEPFIHLVTPSYIVKNIDKKINNKFLNRVVSKVGKIP